MTASPPDGTLRDPSWVGQVKVTRGLTYKDAGVDIDAGNELVERIKGATAKTRRPEQLSGIGGFAALAALPERYAEPILVTGTDGVGTKLKLAIDNNRHDSVGQDLVAMCANDVLVTGAEPFLFLDYYATAKLDVDVAERVIKGIAHGCELAGCALVGGETAEMPGFYSAGDYDLAGFCIGVVEKNSIISGEDIKVGHRLVGLPSSGPHSNGFSLIRRIVEVQGSTDPSLLDQLMTPTRIYARPVLQLLEDIPVAGMSHITGGGLLENLPRMFRDPDLAALVDRDAWRWPDVFAWLQQAGNVDETEMLRTFNCGIGFVVCVAESDVEATLAGLTGAGEEPVVIGEVVARTTDVPSGKLLIR